MNNGTQTALERAFELARSGRCKGMDDIRSALAAEGYAQAQVTGYSLSKQLRALMKAASPPEAHPAPVSSGALQDGAD